MTPRLAKVIADGESRILWGAHPQNESPPQMKLVGRQSRAMPGKLTERNTERAFRMSVCREQADLIRKTRMVIAIIAGSRSSHTRRVPAIWLGERLAIWPRRCSREFPSRLQKWQSRSAIRQSRVQARRCRQNARSAARPARDILSRGMPRSAWFSAVDAQPRHRQAHPQARLGLRQPVGDEPGVLDLQQKACVDDRLVFFVQCIGDGKQKIVLGAVTSWVR